MTLTVRCWGCDSNRADVDAESVQAAEEKLKSKGWTPKPFGKLKRNRWYGPCCQERKAP